MQLDKGQPIGVAIRELEEIREQQLWTEASNHRYGSGLEHGCDLTAIKKYYHHLVQQGHSSKAGLLMCIAAGGLWPQGRKAECGLMEADRNVCPHM